MKHLHTPKKPPETTAELKLWNAIRAGFVAQGTSLAAWAKAHDIHKQNIRSAVFKERNGPKAKALIKRCADAAGVRVTKAQITPRSRKSHRINEERV